MEKFMPDSTFATGGCACGAVTYTISGEPKTMVQCHCNDCKKATGTGHISLAFFTEDDVAISNKGPDVLSKGLAKDPDAIESLMNSA